MNFKSLLKKKIHRNLSYFRDRFYESMDRRTDRKILVIESDDWGSIRVPSIEAKCYLLRKGYDMDSRPFERCDSLESDNDLDALYNVLLRYKDTKGNPPIFTLNTLMANPDFSKIKESGFSQYFYEDATLTYLRYSNSSRVPALMQWGEEKGLVYMQSHGREHVNYSQWLDLLRKGNTDQMTAFELGMCGIFPKNSPESGNKLMRALSYSDNLENNAVLGSVCEGLQLFEKRFGRKSISFVAPCSIWSNEIEQKIANAGVQMIQTARVQNQHDISNQRKVYHYMGEKNRYGQLYSVRNCIFEPAINRDGLEAERCFCQVSKAFASGKIAVISSHRINYTSRIIPDNGKMTLKQLDNLLGRIVRTFGDVEFMTSPMLLGSVL